MKTLSHNESGFSLVESLVSTALLSAGMLAIAVAFLQGAVVLSGSEYDVVAREKAAEAIESVFTARDTRIIQWSQIRNKSQDAGGVFEDGAKALKRPGDDGLVNTADDPSAIETITKPGPDGLLGTEDDDIQELTQFTREIRIRDVSLTLREVQVIIRYTVGSDDREYTITTLISSYA